MKKKIISMFLSAVVALSCVFAMQATFGAAETGEAVEQTQLAQENIQGAAILHCFNWSYQEIKAKLADIAAAGYTAVQTSPVQRPKDYSASYTDMSGQWWKLYQPLTLSVADGGTWLGTKAELSALCTEADKYNIKVIVDIVSNHMANKSDGGTFANLNSNVESDLQNANYYHTESYGADDTTRYKMTHGHIGMPDLNTGNAHVQERVLGLLKECVDLGVDGFRFDAAKHIELPTDNTGTRSDYWKNVIEGIKSYKSDVYCYGEILTTALTSLSNYTKYIDVTDNTTGNNALSAAKSGNAATLASSTYKMGAGAEHSVLWAESHDTYMDKETSGVSNSVIYKAWAITGARANSTSLYLARPNSIMGRASTDTGWKSTAVAAVNKFKNFFMGQAESLSSDGGKTAYIERGTTGVCIAKLDGAGAVSLTAKKMAAGTYTDQITGNTFTVSDGKITGTVGSTGVAVVYDPAAAQPTTAFTTAAPSTQPTTSAQTQTVLMGDSNQDGKLTIKDVTLIQRHAAELTTLTGAAWYASDCSSDGNVTVEDATLLQKYLSEYTDCGVAGTEKEISVTPTAYTVSFANVQKWSGDIYCYYWSDANAGMTTWPGEKMTYSGVNGSNQDIYTLEIPLDAQYVIFDNKTYQTVNIPFDGSNLRFYAKSTTDSSGKYRYGTW